MIVAEEWSKRAPPWSWKKWVLEWLVCTGKGLGIGLSREGSLSRLSKAPDVQAPKENKPWLMQLCKGKTGVGVGKVIFRRTCVLAKGSGIGAELSVAPPHLWCLDEHCCPVIMRSQCQEE